MGNDDLSELVGIWERWTNSDPLLREAVQEYGVLSTRTADLLDCVLDHLTVLANLDEADAATVAALSAGWAVLLALDGDVSYKTWWRAMVLDAQEAHLAALAAWPAHH